MRANHAVFDPIFIQYIITHCNAFKSGGSKKQPSKQFFTSR
jgi:hypothetical protein